MSGEQGIHVIADAITEVVADEANAIQPGDQNIAIGRRQLADDLESLFEHADECIEERFVLIAEVVAESGGALAVEHHQFRQSRRIADCFSVSGDSLFGFNHGRILVAQHVWPKPAVQHFLIRPQSITADAEARMKKRAILLVGGVEILDQTY